VAKVGEKVAKVGEKVAKKWRNLAQLCRPGLEGNFFPQQDCPAVNWTVLGPWKKIAASQNDTSHAYIPTYIQTYIPTYLEQFLFILTPDQ
jgi:hypothetical protein